MAVFRIYVEKKPEFAVEANGVRHDISTLGIKVKSVRLFNRYDVEGIDPETFETASRTIFSEPAVDVTCAELPALQPGQRLLAVEYLPGQFDQRADSCEQCIQIMTQGDRPRVRNARVYLIDGEISDEEFETIKNTLINPVEAREASLAKFDTLAVSYDIPTTVKTLMDLSSCRMRNLPDLLYLTAWQWILTTLLSASVTSNTSNTVTPPSPKSV